MAISEAKSGVWLDSSQGCPHSAIVHELCNDLIRVRLIAEIELICNLYSDQ